MNRSFLQMLVRRAEHVAARPGADAPGDEQLLARFAREGDEAAFAALLARHGRLVWSVCRGLLSRDADAEDAFQATFLALVRGAKSIRAKASLAPWLHVTATRVCKKVRLTAARRNGREHRVAVREATPSPVPEAAWEAASLAVHEEIAALSPTLRTAFVTCVLEGERHQDAAARLGVPVGTLSARVSRARQTLLDRLSARGLAPGVAAAALALGGAAGPAAVPDILTEAVRGLLPAGTSATPYLITLATTATDGVTMKAKMLAAAVLIAGAASFTTGGWVLNRADAQAAAAPPPPPIAAPRYAAPAAVDPAVAAPAQSAPRMATPNSRAAAGPVAAWEFSLARRPGTLAGFLDLVNRRGAENWEYVGSETLDDGTGEPREFCVFKKPNPNVNLSRYTGTTDLAVRPTPPVPFAAPAMPSLAPPARAVPSPNPPATDPFVSPTPNSRPTPATPTDDLLPTPTTRPSKTSPARSPADGAPMPSSQPAPMAAPARPPVDLAPEPSQPTLTLPFPTPGPIPSDRIDRIILRNVAATDAARAIESFVSKKYKDSDATIRVYPDVRSNTVVVQTNDPKLLIDVKDVMTRFDAPAKDPSVVDSNMILPPSVQPSGRPTLKDLYESTAPPVSVVVTVNHVVPSRAAKALKSYLRASVPDAPEVTVDSDDAKKRIDLKGPNELVKKLAGLVRELDREATPAPLPSVPKPTAVKP